MDNIDQLASIAEQQLLPSEECSNCEKVETYGACPPSDWTVDVNQK